MRLETRGGDIRVFLSERNLRTLLTKLVGSPPNSACLMTYDTRDGLRLWITAESDLAHYANPERDTPFPGPTHPDTEIALSDRNVQAIVEGRSPDLTPAQLAEARAPI